MKSTILTTLIFTLFFLGLETASSQATYEYKIVTSVESIVPMGIGRSRIIESNNEFSYNDLKDSKNTKRKDLKDSDFSETRLLNYYSAVGINFQNIASNDAIISGMINDIAEEGWELFTVISGVESDAGKDDGNGIFINRYIFKRLR